MRKHKIVSATIQDAGSTPAASTKPMLVREFLCYLSLYLSKIGLVGAHRRSIGLIEGTGGIRQATTETDVRWQFSIAAVVSHHLLTARTIKAKTKVVTMPSRPAVNTRVMAMAA